MFPTTLARFFDLSRREGLGTQFAPIPPGQLGAFKYCRDVAAERIGSVSARALPGAQLGAGVYFDFLTSGRFNGLACIVDDTCCIGLARGAVLLTYDLFFRLLSHPAVLPEVGDPRNEKINPQHSEGIFDDEDDLVYARRHAGLPLPTTPPCDPLRQAFAETAAEIAMNFLIDHELAHITHGHLGAIPAQKVPFIAERSMAHGLSKSDSLRLQALEMDADCAGTLFSLNRTRRLSGDPAVRPQFSTLVDTPEKIFSVWTVAIIGLFHIWGLDIDLNDMTGSHPPTAIRFAMAMSCATQFIMDRHPNMLASFVRASHRTHTRMLAALKAIGCTNVDEQFKSFRVVHEDQAAADHINLIHQSWNKIRGELDKHAIVRIAPINPNPVWWTT